MLETCDLIAHYLGGLLDSLETVYMETYGHMNVFDDLVGDTWAIGVEIINLIL